MSDSSAEHIPVLLTEVLHWLDPQPGQVVVDGTVGGGGHARQIAQRLGPTGKLIGVDLDPAALEFAEKRLAGLPVQLIQGNFADLPEILRQLGIPAVHGILLDLGMSSLQLADANRGFSFSQDGPLDMRLDPSRGEPAWRLVNRLSATHLADLFRRYGEERWSRRIAQAIVAHRRQGLITTTGQLAAIIHSCLPRRAGDRIDPATRTFQALRIAVNQELDSLQTALRRLPDCLTPGGRFAVISFHSLEDRLVKQAFAGDERLQVLTRRPIRPSETEISQNPRSRSAKLRVAQAKQRDGLCG
ncbi:MAG TPA: 16S rRNA (cytosine(1402)-N(4))-methyltransferase RsmH [Thermoguttaceae bacterium]|nr:16S rRNA (cytosine(1402)-N(4))-methyltransferase RsmH [Thermoguttaceae bacterium]HPP52755.1 16S rRNA (cytosine(1402)-N(4))-methyltransferase RsmH [Thermoguttaceae bacterium]